MARLVDHTLLPTELQERLESGSISRGEYHRLLPSLPDAALCDHAEVYAQHCAAESLPADPDRPEAYLHHFVLPELVARLRGGHAMERRLPDPRSLFRRLVSDWDAIVARVEREITTQRHLAGLDATALVSIARQARAAVHCRWGVNDLVYDGSVYHTIIPELCRRIGDGAPAS